jgi:hypothetical protein
MNTKVLTVLLVICIIIVACGVYIAVLHNSKDADNVVDDSLEGLFMEVKENTVSSRGLTLIMKNVMPNDSIYFLCYDVEKNVNGNWEQLSYVKEGLINTGITGRVAGNSVFEDEINWEGLYGKLDPGNYRISRGLMSAEFIID